MKPVIIDYVDLLRYFTMTIEIRVINKRWAKIRFKIAILLCRLACKIGNFGLKTNQQVGVIYENKIEPVNKKEGE